MTTIYLILVLVLLPAVIGYFLYTEMTGEPNLLVSRLSRIGSHGVRGKFEPGDHLIYRKLKASPRPGPRARNVQPSEKGDDYYYEVDKFWTVAEVLEDGRMVAVTRTGKQVCLTPRDWRLRKPRLLERMRYRGRFPSV